MRGYSDYWNSTRHDSDATTDYQCCIRSVPARTSDQRHLCDGMYCAVLLVGGVDEFVFSRAFAILSHSRANCRGGESIGDTAIGTARLFVGAFTSPECRYFFSKRVFE